MSARPIDAFADVWTKEFVTSVEMFTGTSIVPVPDSTAESAELAEDKRVWQAHVLTREGNASIWVGIPLSRCLLITADACAEDTERLALYRELLSQSLQGAAQVLNTTDLPGLRCAATFHTEAPPPSIGQGITRLFRHGDAIVPVTLRHDEHLDVLLASADTVPIASVPTPIGDETILPPELERFLGVELPVRVVLGRATLRLRDVLELTVGSVIELDGRPSDLVEVCVRDAVLARGEVVSIRGNYGVRIAHVMNERDRRMLELRGRSRPPVFDGRARSRRVH